ncbi:hypothetical protein DB32_003246 [Sandaracinus amylolyticus]|uniref:Uncharacterized protein n=1 Tax=Sandaracinus amylolyticus TaxID=927083 RepID=A0A0F6YJH4_9BACT|nr:hypothetical protein DB32_003246 [Sandaracinus amylolyticus]
MAPQIDVVIAAMLSSIVTQSLVSISMASLARELRDACL